MENTLKGQLFKRKLGTVFELQDEIALDYDIKQENYLELDIRRKRRLLHPEGVPVADILDKLDYIPQDTSGLISKSKISVGSNTAPVITTYFFNKRVGYMVTPRTLVSLDVDVRSFNTSKFVGVKPMVTHQYDNKTKLKMGFSALPGTASLIIGASRQFASYLYVRPHLLQKFPVAARTELEERPTQLIGTPNGTRDVRSL